LSTSNTADVFSKMLKIQCVATFAVALFTLIFLGAHAGISAVMGGVSVVIGTFFASKVANRGKNKTEPSAILINLLKAEAVKILVIIILLFITFIVYKQLVPFALIAGLAAAALFSGAALSNLNV
jgi:ATP synthase protein I